MNIDLSTGVRVTTQAPLDPKKYFKTIAEMQNLGVNNVLAFTYYDGLLSICVENKTLYIWKEQTANELGVLEEGYTYPANAIANGIDYSNKTYNFFKYTPVTDGISYVGGNVYYTGTGLDYTVSFIALTINNEIFGIPAGTFSLEPGDAQFDRFDIFALRTDIKQVVLKIGQPSANPITQSLNSYEELLAIISVKAGAIESDITLKQVYDENLGIAGSEFDVTTNRAGFDSNVTLATNPSAVFNSGVTCIDYDLPGIETMLATFDSGEVLQAANYKHLIIPIKLKSRPISGTIFSVYLLNAQGLITSSLVNVFTASAIDLDNLNYQDIVIPFELFNASAFSRIVFRLVYWADGAFFDNIRLEEQVGEETGTSISTVENFITTVNQVEFILSTIPNNVDVYVEEIYLHQSDYTLSSNKVILNETRFAGSRVAIRKH